MRRFRTSFPHQSAWPRAHALAACRTRGDVGGHPPPPSPRHVPGAHADRPPTPSSFSGSWALLFSLRMLHFSLRQSATAIQVQVASYETFGRLITYLLAGATDLSPNETSRGWKA